MTFADFVDTHAKDLSPRLREVLVLLALSCDDDTIGLCLHLQRSTVRHYIEKVLDRVGVKTREDVALLTLLSVGDGTTILADVRSIFGPERSERLIGLLSRRTRTRSIDRHGGGPDESVAY